MELLEIEHQQEDEYLHRVVFINAKFKVWYDVDESINAYNFNYFEGTQFQFDELCKKHKKALIDNPIIELNYLTEYEMFPGRKPITLAQSKINRFLYFNSNKENVQRVANYKYLRSGY